MIARHDLLPADARGELEVFQLTTEPEVPACHVYMEAQVFTPDSRYLVLHRSAYPHGSRKDDPEHRYLLCDLENHGELTPLTDETGPTGPAVSPDGQWLYYFVDETELGGGRLTLRRVRLDRTERETLMVLDGPVTGTNLRLSLPYPLSTISSDGSRVAISGFLGDGTDAGVQWGLLVFDLSDESIRLLFGGPTWCNVHPQYCRATDADAPHDIMIQENHGNVTDASGRVTTLAGGLGGDIHVIRDDGTNLRTMPWGRNGNEFIQGHQCWRGRSARAITSTTTVAPAECQLIEAAAAPFAGHVGIDTPGAARNDLSRSFDRPDFYHFATDVGGRRIISDSGPRDGGGGLYLADLPDSPDGPLANVRYLLCPGSSWQKNTHIHPFLSPNGAMGFFNSDESGTLAAYLVRGWPTT